MKYRIESKEEGLDLIEDLVTNGTLDHLTGVDFFILLNRSEVNIYPKVLDTENKCITVFNDLEDVDVIPVPNKQPTFKEKRTTGFPSENHYKRTKLEPVDVILDWDLDFCDGNMVKYIHRQGNKQGESTVSDKIKKADYAILSLIKSKPEIKEELKQIRETLAKLLKQEKNENND